MMLKQVFKTSESAIKHARFRNAHNTSYVYYVGQFYKGRIDLAPFEARSMPDYTWRLDRVRKRGNNDPS